MSSLTILTLAIIAAANMAVGGCIGICGIAGFLLPMLYTGGLGFDVTYARHSVFLRFWCPASLVLSIITKPEIWRYGCP